MTTPTVRTRYAPSPTGMMHVGNLRTPCTNNLIARSLGGSFILRIEEHDQERQVEGAPGPDLHTLREVGMTHDEGRMSAARMGPMSRVNDCTSTAPMRAARGGGLKPTIASAARSASRACGRR
jgi:glutamyl/glutaminyl-tRNA synthetase